VVRIKIKLASDMALKNMECVWAWKYTTVKTFPVLNQTFLRKGKQNLPPGTTYFE